MIIGLAVGLAVFSVSGLVALKYRQLKVWSALYWLLAIVGQLFVLPILIIALGVVFAGWGEFEPVFVGFIAVLTAAVSLIKQLQVRSMAASYAERLGIATRADFYFTPGDVWRWLLVLRCRRSGLLVDKHIAYGDLAAQRLDMYRLAVADEPRPILIHIHGGAWVAGKKGQMGRPLIHSMAAACWLVIDIEYRLGPVHRYPAMIEDVLKAIAWVKANAADYGGRGDFIALTGGSAGGHLTALAGSLKDADRRELQRGFAEVNTQVQAIIPFYGRYDFMDRFNIINDPKISQFMVDKVMPAEPSGAGEQLWRQASPIDQVGAHLPPCMVIHGTGDCMIDIAEAGAFVEAQQLLSVAPFHFVRVPRAQHAFDLGHCPQADAVNKLAGYFLQDCYQCFLGSQV
ncbi:alpha/beta hydrolase fold domain-containing protein [Zhongshania guokunii]|uniref:Alpha/beta hydrolase fold domain-containing protein n=1 Tax=Zhongshania guokunii TaxID=641783 RepID=A0ABV3U5W6_9GAMM